MTLPYLALSLAGVGALVLLNWLMLRPQPPRLDRAVTEALLRLDDPAIRVTDFAGGGVAGLAMDQAGRCFAIAVLGDRLVSRSLAKGSLARIEAQPAALRLILHDVTFRTLNVVMNKDGEAKVWCGRLQPLLDH